MLIAKAKPYHKIGVMTEEDCAADDARQRAKREKRKELTFNEFLNMKLRELDESRKKPYGEN